MSQWATLLVTREEVFWSRDWAVNTHDEIMARYGLREGDPFSPAIVRAELRPPDDDFTRPLEEWEFALYQDRLPVWYEREEVEARARDALRAWAAYRMIFSGYRSLGRGTWFVGGDAVVDVHDLGHVIARASAVVRVHGAEATGYERACILAPDTGTLALADSARAWAAGHTYVVAHDNAFAVLDGDAQALCDGSSRFVARGRARIIALQDARGLACGEAVVRAQHPQGVVAVGGAAVSAYPS